jgi:hypothetical protein
VKRREFITLLGGAATTWPLAASAQQGRIKRIGIIDNGPLWDHFRHGLREHGLIEGRTVALETSCVGVANKSFSIRHLAARIGTAVNGHARSEVPIRSTTNAATVRYPLLRVAASKCDRRLRIWLAIAWRKPRRHSLAEYARTDRTVARWIWNSPTRQ